MAVVILRPALVYGAAAKGNLALLAKAARVGMLRPPALGARSMVAVADLCELLCLVAQESLAGVHTWIVTDGQRYSTRTVFDAMRYARQRKAGFAWLPVFAWRGLACLLDAVTGRPRNTTFDKLFGTELYSNSAVLAATSWRPKVTLEQVAIEMMSTREVIR